MGVHGLWEILLTTAESVTLDNLSGKVVAIDASIWIVKATSVFNSESQVLKSLLDKIIFLKTHNILPVFVFDGTAPTLKKKTLQKRMARRS